MRLRIHLGVRAQAATRVARPSNNNAHISQTSYMRKHRSIFTGNKRPLLFSLVVTAILSLVPISSHATVDWTEGFEYASQTAMEAFWVTSCPGNTNIISPSTTRFRSGSRSLKETFTGQTGDAGHATCFISRNMNASSETMYARWYVYMDNFTVNATGTKSTRHEKSGVYPGVWWVMKFGSTILSADIEGIIRDDGAQGTQSVFGGSIPQNTWVCVETQLTMSDPGVDNGIVRQWINGVQTINKTNQRMRAATLTLQNSPTATFRGAKLYTQLGRGVIYYDDYAVSRDARIGCTGTPTGDTTPPAAPTGVAGS